MEVCQDITPVRLLVEELQQTENRYYAIFNTITSPVFVVDPLEMVITDCNAGAEYLYGYGHDEICGSPFARLFAHAKDAKLPTSYRDACYIERLCHVNKAGETLWVSMGFAALEESDRALVLVTFNDITRIIQAEKQMIHAGKMATLGTMATGVAHELNQPLTVLKSSISLLTRRQKKGIPIDGELLSELLPEMDSYVDKASQIINDMREFGRKDEARPEFVDVPCVVEKAVRMFKEQFRLRDVALRVDSSPDLPGIMAEPHRLEQVLVNHLINARDSVCKRWDDGFQDEPKVVTVAMSLRQGRVEIAISDNGVGMDEKTRKQIFDPFFTTKGPGEGTGIGLSISDNIVRDYGGTTHVWSKPGKGSRFTLSFSAVP
jgi:histidine kinase